MRIAVWHNLPSGGGKRALYDHVRGLVARGHTVEAWCPPTADPNYLPLGQLVPEHVVPIAGPFRPRVTDYWQLTLAVRRHLSAMEEHCRRCAAEINQSGFDVLLAGTCRFFHSAPIGRFVTIPSVLYLQEPCRSLYEAAPRLPWIARSSASRSGSIIREWRATFADWRRIRNHRLQAGYEVDNAAAFRKILVNSMFSRESVIRAYGLDAKVCYLGIDIEHFVDRQLPREGYVVGLGSFSPLKNIRFAIEAIGAMDAPRPKLIWVGNEVYGQSYLDEMRSLAVAMGVEFVPQVNVSDDALIDILCRAAAMIYAPRLEPFGLAPLEAGACGVPVVAVAEGGVRETVVDQVTGMHVVNYPAAAAAALTRLQRDPALARSLGSNARIAVKERWSLERAIDRIERSLQAVIDAAGGRDVQREFDEAGIGRAVANTKGFEGSMTFEGAADPIPWNDRTIYRNPFTQLSIEAT